MRLYYLLQTILSKHSPLLRAQSGCIEYAGELHADTERSQVLRNAGIFINIPLVYLPTLLLYRLEVSYFKKDKAKLEFIALRTEREQDLNNENGFVYLFEKFTINELKAHPSHLIFHFDNYAAALHIGCEWGEKILKEQIK